MPVSGASKPQYAKIIGMIEFEANPFGKSITTEDIVDAFGFFDSWEEKYGYIIDLGRKLPALPEALRTADFILKGCQSQVWLVKNYYPDQNQLQFGVDSDAHIVKGLAGITLCAYNYKSPEAIANFDISAYFATLELAEHLSPTRSNGLQSMVKKIQTWAKSYL